MLDTGYSMLDKELRHRGFHDPAATDPMRQMLRTNLGKPLLSPLLPSIENLIFFQHPASSIEYPVSSIEHLPPLTPLG
jgi:hypothetical protein